MVVCLPMTSTALTQDEVKIVSEAVLEICRGGTLEGTYRNLEITGNGSRQVIVLKKLVEFGIDGSVTFSEGEWKGIQAIIPKDWDQSSHNECVVPLTKEFISKLSDTGGDRDESGFQRISLSSLSWQPHEVWSPDPNRQSVLADLNRRLFQNRQRQTAEQCGAQFDCLKIQSSYPSDGTAVLGAQYFLRFDASQCRINFIMMLKRNPCPTETKYFAPPLENASPFPRERRHRSASSVFTPSQLPTHVFQSFIEVPSGEKVRIDLDSYLQCFGSFISAGCRTEEVFDLK